MTRVVAGAYGGRRLETPTGAGTRPTGDKVREALFSRVESLVGGLAGTNVLDLYAGSGAVGLEALSRGAARAVLVESDRRAAGVARRNVAALGLGASAQVVARAVEAELARPPRFTAQLLFADPPYDLTSPRLAAVLDLAQGNGWLTGDALLVVERSARSAWRFPGGVEALGERRYGGTTLWYGHRV